MSSKENLSRMTIDLPEKDHKRLKALAAVLGTSMREIVTLWIHEHLYSKNKPNAETLAAMKQAERGEDLIESKDMHDLFKQLGI